MCCVIDVKLRNSLVSEGFQIGSQDGAREGTGATGNKQRVDWGTDKGTANLGGATVWVTANRWRS